jgi:CubicO group peptidase (beta-lactamase class C family)
MRLIFWSKAAKALSTVPSKGVTFAVRIVALTLAVLSFPLAAAPPADFDARVESLRAKIGVPGMAIAIVENGAATLAHGYGVSKMGAAERIDADTIFPTGSTGKAFTVAALATLVDAGKLSWDDKVTDRLPGFQMYDPWVTREMTIRDLLVHRSGLGLGAGDMLMVPRGSISRAEAVKRLRFIKPATSFRSGYAYDNVLYMVAGQLIEAVSGQTWENYVHEHVLVPAGMTTSTSDSDRRFATANRAYPHARPGRVRGTGTLQLLDERDELGRAAAPAGGLSISANDMAKWLNLQLAHGKLPSGERLFSEAAHAAMWKPEVLQPNGPLPDSLKLAEPMFQAYALGWGIRDYRGVKIVTHGGAVLGFQSVVTLIPSKNIGFAIEINSEDGEIVLGLMYELLDHYLGFERNDWPEKYSAYKQERLAGALKALDAPTAKPAKVGPSLALARYAGTYADPWYGTIEVGVRKGALTIDFQPTPRMAGTLEHWQYDTFVTRLDDKTIEPAYVTFSLDADGKVDRITMKPVSPLADFSYDYQDLLFTPVKKP